MIEFNPKQFIRHLPHSAGVYQMFDVKKNVIYVGKAKDLKKRVSSYFNNQNNHTEKTKALVAQIANIEIIVTHTETEALLLEIALIKQYQPRYNILLRGDSSYPYLFISAHSFPRLSCHRGTKRAKGRYFGPYPHASAVYESLHLLKKIFPIRQCEDNFFKNRSRPCLEYQIKRCSAPCVNLISPDEYAEEVQRVVLFLQGKNQQVITELVDKMNFAAQQLEYEHAAKYRDQISALRKIQETQSISTEAGNVDIIAAAIDKGIACVQVMTIRAGHQLGSRAFFPKYTGELQIEDLLTAFVPQYYFSEGREIPEEIILQHSISELVLITATLQHRAGRAVNLHSNARGVRARWLAMTVENAQVALLQQRPNQYREQFAALTLALQLDTLPERIECFDISHTLGEATVASCVVFDHEGAKNSAYRRFNIEDITAGDDYAAMRQALTRRYSKTNDNFPDVLLIDGGRQQVNVAIEVLTELAIHNIRIIGVAKGMGRKAGLESLILPNEEKPLLLAKHSPALHLIQQIRDEAHRFAITAHRQRRAKARKMSRLEEIEGIGAKRRQLLLTHFGGLSNLARAAVEDIAKIPTISKALAQRIYDFFK